MLCALLVNENSLTTFSGQRGYRSKWLANYGANVVPLHMRITDVSHVPPSHGIYLEKQKTEWKLWGPRQIPAEVRIYLKKQQTVFLDAKGMFPIIWHTRCRINYLCWANTRYIFRCFDISSYVLKYVLMLARQRWYLKKSFLQRLSLEAVN